MHVLIAEDHPLFAQSLSQFCLEKGHAVSWVKSASEFKESLSTNTFDLALVDLVFKNELDGFYICEEFKRTSPKTKIIILSTFDQEQLFIRAQQLKVDGYLLKTAKLSEIELAITQVVNGGQYFSKELREKIERKTKFFHQNHIEIPQIRRMKLTPKENEILRIIVEQEHNDKAIASQLGISAHTVRDHKKKIYDKLGIHDVVELVKFYYQHLHKK